MRELFWSIILECKQTWLNSTWLDSIWLFLNRNLFNSNEFSEFFEEIQIFVNSVGKFYSLSELLTKCNICLITTKLGPHLYISSNFTDEIVIILNSPYFTCTVLKSGPKKLKLLYQPRFWTLLYLTQNDVILLSNLFSKMDKFWENKLIFFLIRF